MHRYRANECIVVREMIAKFNYGYKWGKHILLRSAAESKWRESRTHCYWLANNAQQSRNFHRCAITNLFNWIIFILILIYYSAFCMWLLCRLWKREIKLEFNTQLNGQLSSITHNFLMRSAISSSFFPLSLCHRFIIPLSHDFLFDFFVQRFCTVASRHRILKKLVCTRLTLCMDLFTTVGQFFPT